MTDHPALQVEAQEKAKVPKGRALKRLKYTRRFVNVTLTGGKRKVSRTLRVAISSGGTGALTPSTDEPQPRRCLNDWFCYARISGTGRFAKPFTDGYFNQQWEDGLVGSLDRLSILDGTRDVKKHYGSTASGVGCQYNTHLFATFETRSTARSYVMTTWKFLTKLNPKETKLGVMKQPLAQWAPGSVVLGNIVDLVLGPAVTASDSRRRAQGQA